MAAPAGGEQRWVARDFGPQTDLYAGMVLSPAGTTVYVAGSASGNLALAAYDSASGATRWEILHALPGDRQYFPQAMTISPDGTRLFVTGDVEESVFTRSGLTIAVDAATGEPEWSARESAGAGRDILPNAIAVSPEGSRVFITGARTGAAGGDDFWDYFTAAYSAASGARAWRAVYQGPGARADTPVAIGVAAGGDRVYVTGTSDTEETGRDFATIAYDSGGGSELWVSRYGTDADDYASALAPSPDGRRVYVAGTGGVPTGSQDFRTVAYDATTGAELGVASYDSGAADWAGALAVAPNGARLYVTGIGGDDFATVAYAARTGRRLWVARYGSPGRQDDGTALAVSPDGTRVYVTGTSQNGRLSCGGDVASTDYATLGYDALTGARLWAARYGGLAAEHPDAPGDVAVGADPAAVFVSGISDDGCNPSDVATLSYRAHASATLASETTVEREVATVRPEGGQRDRWLERGQPER